jgi:hypothetical protein
MVLSSGVPVSPPHAGAFKWEIDTRRWLMAGWRRDERFVVDGPGCQLGLSSGAASGDHGVCTETVAR